MQGDQARHHSQARKASNCNSSEKQVSRLRLVSNRLNSLNGRIGIVRWLQQKEIRNGRIVIVRWLQTKISAAGTGAWIHFFGVGCENEVCRMAPSGDPPLSLMGGQAYGPMGKC